MGYTDIHANTLNSALTFKLSHIHKYGSVSAFADKNINSRSDKTIFIKNNYFRIAGYISNAGNAVDMAAPSLFLVNISAKIKLKMFMKLMYVICSTTHWKSEIGTHTYRLDDAERFRGAYCCKVKKIFKLQAVCCWPTRLDSVVPKPIISNTICGRLYGSV